MEQTSLLKLNSCISRICRKLHLQTALMIVSYNLSNMAWGPPLLTSNRYRTISVSTVGAFVHRKGKLRKRFPEIFHFFLDPDGYSSKSRVGRCDFYCCSLYYGNLGLLKSTIVKFWACTSTTFICSFLFSLTCRFIKAIQNCVQKIGYPNFLMEAPEKEVGLIIYSISFGMLD